MKIGAILLAAGNSSRFEGGNKLLATVGAKPLIRRLAEELTAGKICETIVVTGHDRNAIESSVQDLPLRCVFNEDWALGMGGSIATGFVALDWRIDGAFVVPGDMPFVSSGMFETLIETFAELGGQKIVFPVSPAGEQRNPVLWPQALFPDLASLSGKKGGKRLLARVERLWCPVAGIDERALMDVDTVETLRAITES